ncbi:hypothetical protein JAAARDRAFT_34743 [Jaapia argillacea MUCL 33604]|uniref:PNPLA domain-containing protein n=1 Tax=Jaapia argillacea MUCL 33604 TaxID=933084 RepID=A0A067Q383_9AGAM|nr:hypothetical protein JAAARDRAFT_34743 [Jaapia argillacea MUCL 33604]
MLTVLAQRTARGLINFTYHILVLVGSSVAQALNGGVIAQRQSVNALLRIRNASSCASSSSTIMAIHAEEPRGLRLLSLDGGGIRGLSELLVLRELMQRIQHQDKLPSPPLPCEYFDLIGGTSTGGFIALMLGRLRMSVDEAIAAYGRLAESVFSEKKWMGQDGMFKKTNLEKAIKDIVGKATSPPNPEVRMLDPRPEKEVCKTFVCAMAADNMNASIPRLFRTYPSPKNASYDCTIWEAARATSAAPTFFKPIDIGDTVKERFVDAGLGNNNPTMRVIEEADLIFPGRSIACIISIGSGQAHVIKLPKSSGMFQNILPLQVVQALRDIATDCERTADDLEKHFRDKPDVYFRFNVEQGLQSVSLGDWDKLGEVGTHTQQYLRKNTVDQRVSIAVKTLREAHPMVESSELVQEELR